MQQVVLQWFGLVQILNWSSGPGQSHYISGWTVDLFRCLCSSRFSTWSCSVHQTRKYAIMRCLWLVLGSLFGITSYWKKRLSVSVVDRVRVWFNVRFHWTEI